MPETAASPSLPTFTVTVLLAANVVEPASVAVTVTVVALSSSPTLEGLTDSEAVVGAVSSSVMVPVAVDVPSVAFVGEARVTVKVSAPSAMVSSVVCTSMVPDLEPALMVSVAALLCAV